MTTIYLSDLHLGSKHSDTKKIKDFIYNINPDKLFLVGDIIDGWKFTQKKWKWDKNCDLILKRIIELSEKIPIVYLKGNHDDFLVLGKRGHIEIIREYVSDKTLILHGDQFDKTIDRFGHIGDKIYDLIEDIGHTIDINLKMYIKKYSKFMINHIFNFETLVYSYTLEKGCYNVVTGHIHEPKIEKKEHGYYINCGRWLKQEPCTYIIEENNEFKLHEFK